jgi:uncharacterized protein (TIGR02118 family)
VQSKSPCRSISCQTLPRCETQHIGWIRKAKLAERNYVIKVSVLYPYRPGSKFDMVYYLQHHIPMVQKFLGSAAKGVTVDQGLSGMAPGTAMTYMTVAEMLFNSVEEFHAAFDPHAAEIVADVPNYTDIQPIMQISEVKL